MVVGGPPSCQYLNPLSDEEDNFSTGHSSAAGIPAFTSYAGQFGDRYGPNTHTLSVLTLLTPTSRTYLLQILQQPATGAEHGSYVLSRLPLSPPLILQLNIFDRIGAQITV